VEAVSNITSLKYRHSYIVAHGTPMDGLEFIGPFDSFDEGCAFASMTCALEWWVVMLRDPYEYT